MKRFFFKINCSKITKAKLWKGENGQYLQGTLILNDEAKMEGFIVENQTKEEREQKVKGNILGNFKIVENKPTGDTFGQATEPVKQIEDDLPF
jgi:hypothetical protein